MNLPKKLSAALIPKLLLPLSANELLRLQSPRFDSRTRWETFLKASTPHSRHREVVLIVITQSEKWPTVFLDLGFSHCRHDTRLRGICPEHHSHMHLQLAGLHTLVVDGAAPLLRSPAERELIALDNRKPGRLPTMCRSMDPSAATERHPTLNVRICRAPVLTSLLGGSHFNMANYLYFTDPLCETPHSDPSSCLCARLFFSMRPLLPHPYILSH